MHNETAVARQWDAACAYELNRDVKSSDLTQAEISERTGVSPSSLTRYIRGRRSIYAGDLAAILAVLGVDPREFVGRVDARAKAQQ